MIRAYRIAATAALLVLVLVSAGLCAQPIGNFSFAHTSDDHVQPLAPVTISEFVNPQPIKMEPFNMIALPVSFVVDTGDITEFGGRGSFEKFQSFYKDVKIPYYIALGNHDNTWRSLAPEMRKLYGSPYYSFDKHGVHFAVICSAGFQHPLPSITPEQLAWLKKDLAKVGKDAPVFLALHHPLNTTEFASRFDVDRLLDLIRPYNIVVIMYGHGHSANHGTYENFTIVQGGSTYGPGPAGYQVYSVMDGILRVAYKDKGPEPKATKKMIEKPLAPPAKRYPNIKIDSPREGATYGAQVQVKAWIAAGKGEITNAAFAIDGSKDTKPLTLMPGGSFEATLPLSGFSSGAHSLKLTFTGQDGATYHRSTFFYVDSERPKVRWRVLMDTASKTTPTVSDSLVYIGGYDGSVRAYEVQTGKLKWQYQTGGGIAGQILLQGDKVYAGSEDMKLHCLNAANGKNVWEFEAEEPIYSSPVSDGKSVYFGCGSGAFYSVDAAKGTMNWVNNDAKYNIEIKPFLHDGKVYYGAWDTFIYCVNTADGKLVWKHVGQGSSHGGAAAYYSPGDCGPVVCNGVVFTPDRKYEMSLSDYATGNVISSMTTVAAVGLSADGQSVYLRRNNNKLDKVDSTGKTIWSADVPTGMVPAAPTEVDGVVYVCGNKGTVSAISAADGKVLWQYDSTPTLYVLAGVGASGSTAYVVGTDGSLTALSTPK